MSSICKMSPRRKDLLVKFIKCLTFLSLIFCFAHFYLFDIFENYQKKATTFTYKRESLKEPTWPVITICSEIPFKTEILRKKYKLNRTDFFNDKGKNVTKPLWDLYDEVSFKLNQDFTMEVFINQWGWHDMMVGETILNGSESIFLEEFPTQSRGLCYGLSVSNVQMVLSTTIAISIRYQAPEFEQSGMVFHFSAENSGKNIIWNTWPHVQKLSYSLAFDSNMTNAKIVELQETEWKFYNGNENCDNGCQTQQCLTWNELLDGIDCPNICLPVIWKGLFKNTTSVAKCNETKENNCMHERFLQLRESKVKNCQPPQYEIEYKATFESPSQKKKTPNMIQLRINYQDSKTIKEEMRIYDEASLIGTLGGFLGLFVGFSFYDTLCYFIDVISSLF